jgi:spore coat polysaccharide biosynthesis protein SpsF (cytidylyltransferase family)
MLGCIIQARMSSTRLPGKVMKLLDGKNPSISFTISQLQQSKEIDKIIVATTTNKEDDIIVDYLKNSEVDFFRGSSNDVLGRYYECALEYSLSGVLRITADCPLIDPTIVDKGLTIFKNNTYDYVSNTLARTFPDGNETEIFSFNALKRANNEATLPSEREHVTPYFKTHPNLFNMKNFENFENLSHLRWTMDYEEDLKLIKLIFKKIPKRPILMNDILNLLKNEPDLKKINSNHYPDESYQKSLIDENQLFDSKN